MAERSGAPEGEVQDPRAGLRAIAGDLDKSLLQEPLSRLETSPPIVFSPAASVTEATRDMQQESRGCVLITQDGTQGTPLIGIFTERDVLLRIVDRGRNPAALPLREAMTPDPEVLPSEASIGWALDRMVAGGFRHMPVIDAAGRPVIVVSAQNVMAFLLASLPPGILRPPSE
jgi:CBS domain-containing protein